MAVIDFYDAIRAARKRGEKKPQTIRVNEAHEIVHKLSVQEAAKAAYYLNQWNWPLDVLGDFPGYERAWEYAHIFNSFVSKYEIFKYECKSVLGMSDEEFKEAVLKQIFDAVR